MKWQPFIFSRFVEELSEFDKIDLDETILNELDNRLRTRAAFDVPQPPTQPIPRPEDKKPEKPEDEKGSNLPPVEKADSGEIIPESGTSPPEAQPPQEEKPPQEAQANPPEANQEPPAESGPIEQPSEVPNENSQPEKKEQEQDEEKKKEQAKEGAAEEDPEELFIAEKLLGKRSVLILIKWLQRVVRYTSNLTTYVLSIS